MSKYDVYGIGNAIVDHEVLVTQADLDQLGIEKGVMTLIEADVLNRYMAHFGDRVRQRTGGGSAANTILGATQLGAKCFYSCKVSSDEPGQFYLHDLAENGVDVVTEITADPEELTGHCLVMITDDAERSMATHLGITGSFSIENIQSEILKNSDYLYIEGYLVASPTGKSAAIRAKEIAEPAGVKTALTLSDANMVQFFKDGLSEMIGDSVDVLFANEQEALLFTETTSVTEALNVLRRRANCVVITQGASGALVDNGVQTYSIPGRSVEAIDTNGAGDLFAGAFLAALAAGESTETAGHWGVRASSELVTQFGARLKGDLLNEVKTALGR